MEKTPCVSLVKHQSTSHHPPVTSIHKLAHIYYLPVSRFSIGSSIEKRCAHFNKCLNGETTSTSATSELYYRSVDITIITTPCQGKSASRWLSQNNSRLSTMLIACSHDGKRSR